MPELVDYYTVLGIPSTASADEVRKARQRLAKQYHPDRNQSPAAHQMMALVNRAATVLLDPAQRALYDAKLAQEDATSTPAPPPATQPAPPPKPSRHPAHTRRDPAQPRPQPRKHAPPPRPTHATSPATPPSLLARALRGALMQLTIAVAWAVAIALGVASLILASGLRSPWLKLLVFIPLIAISFLLPTAAIARVRRILYPHPPQPSRKEQL